jgi:hypothetical protein
MSLAFKKSFVIRTHFLACAILLSMANAALAGGINTSANSAVAEAHTSRIIVKYKSNATTSYNRQKQTATAELVGVRA